jgi:hypothetical protein
VPTTTFTTEDSTQLYYKICEGIAYGTCTTRKDRVNADLLDFIKP